ncbi:MAG: GNAT family N-acetyltransferase [Candidatus Elarobacter sp.]
MNDRAPSVTIKRLSPETYVREVLSRSNALWAGARTFDEYTAEFTAIVASPFGRRFSVLGLQIDGALVASCKRYTRSLRCGERIYKAAGIGAVFTPAEFRGRGYATALLGALLDRERELDTDCAYLYSDIAPAFYQRIGFEPLPSRLISLRSASVRGERVAVSTLTPNDLPAIRKVFDALDSRRPFSFRRTPLDWEWQRLRAASREDGAPPLTLGVRQGRTLAAYVTGRRLPKSDAFIVDEFAYAGDGDRALIMPLLRAAAGDLRTIRGWLPPSSAREALPRGAVRRRGSGISMLVPVSKRFRAAWNSHRAGVQGADSDPCWSTDHV